jgi:hypothetical protein
MFFIFVPGIMALVMIYIGAVLFFGTYNNAPFILIWFVKFLGTLTMTFGLYALCLVLKMIREVWKIRRGGNKDG